MAMRSTGISMEVLIGIAGCMAILFPIWLLGAWLMSFFGGDRGQ